MEWYWIVLIVALFLFSLWKAYKLGFKLGYKTGAEVVLKEWKKNVDMMGEDING